MRNKKVIIQIIDKLGNHGKPFAFHNDKGADHGVGGKAFAACSGMQRNRGQIEMKKKGIVKYSNRLGSKKPDVFDKFLTVDNNQLLCSSFVCQLNDTPSGADCYYKFIVIKEFAMFLKAA